MYEISSFLPLPSAYYCSVGAVEVYHIYSQTIKNKLDLRENFTKKSLQSSEIERVTFFEKLRLFAINSKQAIFGAKQAYFFLENVTSSISELRRDFYIKFSQIEVQTFNFRKLSDGSLILRFRRNFKFRRKLKNDVFQSNFRCM